MGRLDEMIIRDGATLFSSADGSGDFDEAVVFKPRGGDPVPFYTQVFRGEYSQVAGRPAPDVQVWVPIRVASSINKDGDRVSLAEREGGAAADHPIAAIVTQGVDGFMLRLR